MSRIAGLLCAVSLAAAGNPTSARQADPAPLHLDDVLARVRAGNPTVRAERLATDALAKRRGQVTSWSDPMVSATVNAGPGRMQRGQIMVEQALPWPDVLDTRGAIADAAAESQARTADATRDEVVLQATLAYVEAAGIERKLAQIGHFREELAAFERAAAVQYESGTGPQQAILRTQLEKNGLMQRSLALEARLSALRQRLIRLAGSEAPTDWTSRGLSLPEPAMVGVAEAPEDAARARPEWLAREATIRRIEAEHALAGKAFRPDFSVRLVWMEGSVMRDHADAVGIGVGVRVPLWRTPRRALVEEKELDLLRQAAHQDDLAYQVATEAAAIEASIASHVRTLHLLDGTLLPQAEATQQATLTAYTNGQADYLDLLEAERVLLDLRLDRIDHQVMLLKDRATLDRVAPTTESR